MYTIKTLSQLLTKKRKVRNQFKNNVIIELYENSMKNKEILTLKSLKEKYQLNHNLQFSIETLRKHLTQSLNISFKKIKVKNSRILNEQNKMMNYIFINELVKAKKYGCELIWVDESGFSNVRRSKYGWILNNEPAIYTQTEELNRLI